MLLNRVSVCCFRAVAIMVSVLFGSAGLAQAGDLDFCHDEEWMTFEDYQSWIKLTEEPVISYAHGENWIDIYANELAAERYQNLASAYPECAAVVKAIHMGEDDTAIRKITVMVKMPAGYDPEHGDWYYGSFESSGTVPVDEIGRVEFCYQCHEVATETDYLFSDSVMETIREWREWKE